MSSVEGSKINNTTFPHKTALSEANIKANKMESILYFLKILFQFMNLLLRIDSIYQPPKCPYSYFS